MEKYKCIECGHISATDSWSEIDVYCEDCGDHSGVACPECEERYDLVFKEDVILVVED